MIFQVGIVLTMSHLVGIFPTVSKDLRRVLSSERPFICNVSIFRKKNLFLASFPICEKPSFGKINKAEIEDSDNYNGITHSKIQKIYIYINK
jgi:hypothetical protein